MIALKSQLDLLTAQIIISSKGQAEENWLTDSDKILKLR